MATTSTTTNPMTHPDMPELPEAYAFIDAEEMVQHKHDGLGGGIVCGSYSERYRRTSPLYTAAQMLDMYLAGLKTAKAAVPEYATMSTHGDNKTCNGWDACVEQVLASIAALTYAATKDKQS